MYFYVFGTKQQRTHKVITIAAEIWTWWVHAVDWDAWHKAGIYFSQFCFPVLITTSVFEKVRQNLAKTKISKIRRKRDEVTKELACIRTSDALLEKPLNKRLRKKYKDISAAFEKCIDTINKETQSALHCSAIICYIAAGILAISMNFGWNQHMGIFTLVFLAPLAAPRLLTKRILEKHEHEITDITNQFNTAKELCSEEYTTEAKPVLNDMKRFLQTSDE